MPINHEAQSLKSPAPPKSRDWILYAFAVSVVLTVAIHLPMIINDPITMRDDHLLIDPLVSVSTLHEYWDMLKSGQILDFQPLRDLSFWIDIRVSDWVGFGVFHLVNVLVWLGCLWQSSKIFRHEMKYPVIAVLSLILLCVHPCMAFTVAWVSARKHLLSCFFILCAVNSALEGESSKRMIGKTVKSFYPFTLISYFLALLSQPIHLFFPLWLILRGFFDRSSALIKTALFCVPIMGVIAALNYYYYNSPGYHSVAAFSKFQTPDNFSEFVGIPLLSIGRYFFQLIAPFWLSIDYGIGSLPNLVGTLLLPVFGWICIKRLGAKNAIPWLFFTFLPLIWISAAHTNIFVSDSYLLLPATGFFLLVGLVFESLAEGITRNLTSIGKGGRRSFAFVFVLFVLVMTGLSERDALTWRSERAMWDQAFKSERTLRSVLFVGNTLLDDHKIAEGSALAEKIVEVYPRSAQVVDFYAKAIFLNDRLTTDQKILKLSKFRDIGYLSNYFGGHLFSEKKQFERALFLTQRSLLNGPSAFGPSFSFAVAECYFFCQHVNKVSECEAIKEKFRKMDPRWREKAFISSLEKMTADEKAAPEKLPITSPIPGIAPTSQTGEF